MFNAKLQPYTIKSTIMNPRIPQFIEKQRVATFCCVDENQQPYCFSCFYVLDKEQQLLIFKSASSTTHAKLLLENPAVAGTIQPEKLNPLAIKGIQFKGKVVFDSAMQEHSKALYHKKYLFASAVPGEIWCVQLEAIKMTDSTLHFAKKITWEAGFETERHN
jgi:uncharacterized protein